MWCLAVMMFRSRVRAIKSGKIAPKYFKTYMGQAPEEKVIVMGRHYDNQFQVPVLFLITCAVCLAMNSVNVITVILAWVFVVSRLFHSWIHLGSNIVQRRAAAFAFGWLVILLLWAQLVYFALP